MKTRGDMAWLGNEFELREQEGEDFWIAYAAGHMDKKPSLISATTGTSYPGLARIRRFARHKEEQYQVKNYSLEQADMFALYRNHFATIDTFNKAGLGPKSFIHTVKLPLN